MLIMEVRGVEQIIHELQDMTYLSWAKTRNSSGTAGSFLKACEAGFSLLVVENLVGGIVKDLLHSLDTVLA